MEKQMQVTLNLYEADMINIILQNYMDKCIEKGNLHPDEKILIAMGRNDR